MCFAFRTALDAPGNIQAKAIPTTCMTSLYRIMGYTYLHIQYGNVDMYKKICVQRYMHIHVMRG